MASHGIEAKLKSKPAGCSVEGCEKPFKSRQTGFCGMHQERWRKHGDTHTVLPGGHPLSTRKCSVDGCVKSHCAKGFCGIHYTRWRKHGDPYLVRGRSRRVDSDRTCEIEDCDKAHQAQGYCVMHYTRLRRRGTVEFVGHQRVNEPSYRAMHSRLRRDRGPAAEYPCVDCDFPAAHWSYDHTDFDARVSPKGLLYSLDQVRYEPRCKPCHVAFDRDHRELERV